MRAGLAQREPGRVAHWEKTGLYDAILRKRAGAPAFVLHDGPPFTNGDVHIGTALNKTLKDITVRYKAMRGFFTPYVPGWDCHGLPIEQKVARELREAKRQASTPELRRLCDAFSESWIAKQKGQFKRLGVLADWAHEYKTKAPGFEADILRVFASFVEKGLVYRSKKPVYWSIPFETALAEAEVEYKEHASPSIWVRFRVPAEEAVRYGLPADKPLSIVIWTTTPWTLPANLAIALNPEVEYAVADLGTERILVASALLAQVATSAGLKEAPAVVKTAAGRTLENLAARHPFIDRASPVVLADYVTVDSGTGCVHTAPGHGAEDYQTGLKYGLEIYCPVGDNGAYLDDGRIPADLVGVTTLETVEDLEKKRTCPANVAVLRKLDATGSLLAKHKYTHSYPHCWRSKTPIIFRAVDQWFVALDKAGSREAALAEVAKIAAAGGWIPAWGEARIRGAIESRPDWCVSRQRAWGVPIPAFYGPDKRPYLDAGVIRAVADKVQERGTNVWYESSPTEILAGVSLPGGWPEPSALACGKDTLDVWLDSGSSHAAVLRRGQGGTTWPADLYLEGSDQHRGWFQSSLWTSVIAFGRAPYKAVLTHGFIVDEDRKKISKSSSYEKPQTSDAYIADYGADVIRLWIASQDFRDDIPISKEILSHVGETYRLIRNTLRFQLSNLFDFDAARDAVPVRANGRARPLGASAGRRAGPRLRVGLRRLRIPPRLPALQPVLLGHALGDLPRHPEGQAVHAGHDQSPAPFVPDGAPRDLPLPGEDPGPDHPVHDRRGVDVSARLRRRVRERFGPPSGLARGRPVDRLPRADAADFAALLKMRAQGQRGHRAPAGRGEDWQVARRRRDAFGAGHRSDRQDA